MIKMLDFQTYFRRPFSTLSSIASDPLEAWVRVREQYAAHREGTPPPDLYKVQPDWESQLHQRLGLSDAEAMRVEFWILWRKVLNELEAKGIRPGPSSFKGWNDGDAGFVRAIWSLVRCLEPLSVIETGVAHGVTSLRRVSYSKRLTRMAKAGSGASTVPRSNANGKKRSARLSTLGFATDGRTSADRAGDSSPASCLKWVRSIFSSTIVFIASGTFGSNWIERGRP